MFGGAYIRLRWWKVLRHAVRGESPYFYTCTGFITRHGLALNRYALIGGYFFATSPGDAIRQISNRHPDHPIRKLVVSDQFVGIELFIAYPCRLARWVFSYRSMLRKECDGTWSLLLLQTRKAVVVNQNDGGSFIHLAQPADTPMDLTTPDDGTGATVGFWNVGDGNHGSAESPHVS